VSLENLPITPDLNAYMEALLPPREPVLARLEAEAERDRVPIVGPQVGSLLRLLLRMDGCVDVLELGAAIGYSTIWLARGCNGRVTTIEFDPRRAERARRSLAEAELTDRTEVVEGEALRYMEANREPVDCVFNDLLNSFPDQETVERCFALSLERLRPGGLLLADNALRRGSVVAPDSTQARNVARYNELVAAETRLESMVVPLRDGVSIARLIPSA
jgi:predicted O-methyltransferase YrrM